MAQKINAGEVGRSDLFFIDPAELVVEDNLNGRWKPHTETDIDSLVKSYVEDGGQIQPVTVRKIADNRVQLVLGYRRYRAALEYNRRFPDKPMRLKCIVSAMNDEEAFLRNIAENRERKATTPMDDAFNQRRLREEFGWTDTRIAEKYGVSQPYVCQLKKLLGLPGEIQDKVHARELALGAALELVDLSADEQKEALANGTSTQAVRQVAREKKTAKGEGTPRTLSEIRKFFEALIEDEGLMPLADLMVRFANGKLTDKTMIAKLKELTACAV